MNINQANYVEHLYSLSLSLARDTIPLVSEGESQWHFRAHRDSNQSVQGAVCRIHYYRIGTMRVVNAMESMLYKYAYNLKYWLQKLKVNDEMRRELLRKGR